jgi:pimeloyl-ACP methyl ester carboxylesterase
MPLIGRASAAAGPRASQGEGPRGRRSVLKARQSGFSSSVGRSAYAAAYDRVLGSLWPVAHEHVTVPSRYGTSHAIVSGARDAPPVFPGAGLSATSWYRDVEALAPRFRLYAFDLVFDRGLGEQHALVRGPQDCAAWVADLMDGLHLSRASLVGLSQGAWVAASAASYRPRLVDRLVLLAPAATLCAFRLPFWLLFRGLQHALPQGDPAGRTRRTFEMVGASPDERFLDQTALGLEHFREQRPPVLPNRFGDEELGRIEAPTMLLLAEQEILYDPRRALRRAERRLPALEESGLVPGAGHFVTMVRPDLVDARLLSFLGRRGAQAGV